MSVKRSFSELTKFEDINETIKRQMPNTYNPSTSPSLSPMTFNSSMLNSRPQQHNGLNAAQQLGLKFAQQGLNSDNNNSNSGDVDISEKIKPMIPPCKNCNNSNDRVIEDERVGAYICTGCGLETGRIIIETAEWRNFGDGKGDPSRVVAEDRYTGLENVVRTENGGKKPQEQRRMASVNNHLDTLRTAMRSPDALFYASRKLAEQYIGGPVEIIGQSVNTESLAAVCFHTAALESGNPVRKEDIIMVLQLNEKSFNKAQKRLAQVRIWWSQKNDKALPDTNPIQSSVTYLKNYAQRLALSKQSIDAASCMIKTAYDLNIHRNSKPTTIAAATLLFTLSLQERPCNPHELARISHTSFETIRRHANELHLKRDKLVPQNFVEPQQIQNMKAL